MEPRIQYARTEDGVNIAYYSASTEMNSAFNEPSPAAGIEWEAALAVLDRVMRGFLHPIVVVSVPPALALLERRLRLPRLPNGVYRLVALPLVVLGVALICWSVISLVTQGQGTPNPDNPPKVMVEEGPYRHSRNPMVIGMLLLLLGIGLLVRSLLLLIYVPTLGLVTQLYLVRTEEPKLIERFGQAYLDYKLRVPRWLLRGSP